jgi:hypothetical protein
MLADTKPNLASILAFMILVFLPLKMFSFKVGVTLGFSRLFLALGIILVLSYALAGRGRSTPYFVPRAYFSNNMCFLLFFAGLSFLYSYLTYSSSEEAYRVVIMGVRFFESTMILPVIFFLLLNSNRKRQQIILKAVWWWRVAACIAILQFILSLIGLPLSYESIGEAAPENQASVVGFTVLRVNSFFGEPRVLASLLIPIMMFYCITQDRALSASEKCLIAIVGVMTFSNTLVVSLGICLILRPFAGRSVAKKSMYVFAVLIVSLVLAVTIIFFQDSIISAVPRLQIILEIMLNTESMSGAGESVSGDIAAQISDFLILPYIFSGYFLGIDGLVGHGLGSSQLVLRALAQDFFGFTNPDVLFGTRFIVFVLVLDIGLIGCFILMKIVLDLITCASAKSKSPPLFRYYSYCIVAVALFNDSYFFVCYLMFLSVLKGLHEEEDLHQKIKVLPDG